MTETEILQEAKKIVESKLGHNYYPSKKERVKIIIESVLEVTGLTFDEITERTRDESIVIARQVLSYLLRTKSICTLREIAAEISPNNHFNHATMIHSIKMVENMIDVGDKRYDWILPAAKERIDQKILKKQLEKFL